MLCCKTTLRSTFVFVGFIRFCNAVSILTVELPSQTNYFDQSICHRQLTNVVLLWLKKTVHCLNILFYLRRTIRRALMSSDATYWIGLNHAVNENSWRWVNGHGADTNAATLWAPGEPNNFGGNEDCAAADFRNSRNEGYLA